MRFIPLCMLISALLVTPASPATDPGFTAADRDGDGQLNATEVVQALPETPLKAFLAADMDTNGALTEAEYVTAVNDGMLAED